MNIYLHEQAEFYLKNNKIPENSAGIFFCKKQMMYIWWKFNFTYLEVGEEEDFNKSFKRIKWIS